MALPAGRPLPLKVDLRLKGGAPTGRPLIIRPAVSSIQAAAPDGKNPPPPPSPKGGIAPNLGGVATPWQQTAGFLKTKKTWLLAALGVWLVMIAAGLMYLARKHWPLPWLPGLGSLLSAAGGASRQESPLLLSRIENLEKEKMALQGELEQMSQNLRQAAAENAELLKRLEQQSLNYRDKAKAISELEQKLEEAENEAKAVQQEYMALYARSQEEKGLIQKG